jgi:L-iditol 2-dehydrogenase
MKGLVLYPDGHYALDEVPEPSLGSTIYAPHDVLIDVAYCGICGSDVHGSHVTSGTPLSGPAQPVVGGHEMSGTVRAVGPAVTRVKPGDRVVGEIVTHYCGECVNCRAGRQNICVNVPPIEGRIHYTTGGAFAPQVVWPESALHVLPGNVSLEDGVLMEVTAGSVHCLYERMELRPGESVAILGPGARGQVLLQLALAAGARPILVSGVQRDTRIRLPLARKLGADRVVNVTAEDLISAARELTGGQGFDVVVENAGVASAVAQAIEIARPGGRIMISGGGIRGGVTIPLDTWPVIVKELTLYGEISHNWSSWRTAVAMTASGQVDLEPLLTRVYPLSEWEQGFADAATGDDVMRVALRPS